MAPEKDIPADRPQDIQWLFVLHFPTHNTT